MPNPYRTEAPALDRRGNPHIWSWFLKLSSECSLAVKLLGLLIEWSALLDNCEPLDLEFLTGLLNCCDPRRLLAKEALLLAHDLACLALHKVCLLQSACGLVELAKEGVTFGKLCRDGLLFHGLHGFHGSHGFHCLHCFRHYRSVEGIVDQGRIK